MAPAAEDDQIGGAMQNLLTETASIRQILKRYRRSSVVTALCSSARLGEPATQTLPAIFFRRAKFASGLLLWQRR
jgi:hypothetical protein